MGDTAISIVLLPVPAAAMLAGENVTVTPAGIPLALSAIGELSEPVTVAETFTDEAAVDTALTAVLLSASCMVGVLLPSFQWETSALTSTEPSPLARSYPAEALNPVSPGTELLPLVVS